MYVLSEKIRKDLCCRLPRFLNEGKIPSAKRCINKYANIENSPVLLTYEIAIAEVENNGKEYDFLMQKAIGLMNEAKEKVQEEILYFFTFLFAFYIGRKNFEKADLVYELGKNYSIAKEDYGMLWVKFCDETKKVDDGLNALKKYFSGKKKLDQNAVQTLKLRYPNLSKTKEFDAIFTSTD